MKKFTFILFVVVSVCWSIPKPMESIENYNVMLLHGAYGSDQGFLDITDTNKTAEAYYAKANLDNGAALGRYYEAPDKKDPRLLHWLTTKVLDEPEMDTSDVHPKHSYVYQWRSFSNPANSSVNNAVELGKRSWRMTGFEHRRAMMEEAQEVKSTLKVRKNGIDSLYVGQVALDTIRKNPDLYRQLASRYILIGHSMGGVVSREYVQGDFYNGDVDKIITLDSPHEGTGALNMQLRMMDGWESAGKTITQVLFTAGLGGIALSILGGSEFAMNALFLTTASLTPVNFLVDLFVTLKLEHYKKDDPLVCYVDPHGKEKDACKDSINILDLKEKSFIADSMPMFRLLAGKNSMTFTDPKLSWRNAVSWLVPEALTSAVVNVGAQVTGGGSARVNNTNTLTGLMLGLFGGVNLQDHGSSLVETSNGLGLNTSMLIDPNVDVKRSTFNAAKNASDASLSILNYTLSAFEVAFIGMAFIPNEAIKKAARASLVSITAFSFASDAIMATTMGALDLKESHMMPLYKKNLEDWYGEKNSFTPVKSGPSSHTPYLMEDFLYERPFVNLALSDSRTMDSLARNSSASLNPNCYFESDSLQKVPLCEVGLYGSRDSVVVDPVTMKETHIYNAAVAKTDSAGNVVRDSLGNVVYDSVYYGTFEQRKYSEFRNSPLKFKSESDWYKVGVKVDRWERVPGLKPNGIVDSTYVPIRHVERYSVPDIVATGFIEKYSFVVDDLMPHRMRQIKMTFNSNEEVAWECNIKAAEDDPRACAVYKRKLGNSWGDPDTTIGDKGYVAHPIKKNGRFDFNARTYFGNLADIQKDNQNTVMISMVNKIGLSNTQRFYYLFKATDNMLKPKWPEHDVVLNAIDGFKAYVSALDYQGFRVHNASDAFFRDSLGNDVQTYSTQAMDTAIVIGNNNSEYVFVSNQNDSKPAEGSYHWVVSTNINNKELKKPSEPDSSKTDSYEVHFTVDRTAPAFVLTSDAMMNPDSSMFITRFKWAGKDSADRANGSDIRVMRWTLEKANGQPSGGSHATFTKYAELPALYDVASNEFAIAWDKVPQDKRDSMDDGLYRIAAHAIDYAVPNFDAYHKVNALVDSIFSNPKNLSDSLWNRIDSLGLNDTTIYAEFRVDHTAPSLTFRETRAVTAADTVNNGTYVNLSGKYDVLRKNAPSRDSSWTYVSGDSLLQVGYTVKDGLSGRDSAAVIIGWNFVHIADTNVIDHAGDSVWVFDSLGGSTSGSWTEMAGLRMADGEYSVRAVLRDEAKNVRHDVVPKRVRVDRTAPQIIGLTSDHLVYMDTDGDFSATILVSESGDVGVNRTGMHCSYRVFGGSDTSWHEIHKGNRKLLASDTVTFSIDKSAVDTSRGIRYLEAACVDAAGNVSVRTDLFHVRARFPQITYPLPDSIQSNQNYIPIVGIAPKTSSADSLSSVYRLRYRIDNDTTWRTDKVQVVAANRSENVDYISRISQSTEGVLGYFENDSLNNEKLITVELAIASCETCDDWAAVSTNFVVVSPDVDYSKPTVEFAITRNGADVGTFKTGDGPVDISVRLKNKFNGNYMLRVYAEDSEHRGIFDASREKVFYNPYYGTPTATADTAIWFYEVDGKYYLKWKNLDKVNLKVGYNSSKFGETCKSADANQSLADGCTMELSPVDFSSIAIAANAYLSDYPEWMPPAYIDSTMTITKDSGEVVLESSEAFRVYVERKDATDTTTLNIPVYFGESTKPGFYWVEHVNSLVSPLMTGWTVNPNAYGLDYRWDGIATSGAYPSGDITLYAEVTENILDNPFVNIVSKTLKVEQKDVELVVPKSLPDYVALKVPDSGIVATDSNNVVYVLDSMKIYFGLKNGDARIRINIIDPGAVLVKELLNEMLKAHAGDSAYFVTWLGTDSLGMPLAPGRYYVQIEAELENGNVVDSENIPFEYKLMNDVSDGTPDDPKASNQFGFYVAEAKKKADNRYVYEPYADYIAVANMSGWYLPDSLRNRIYNVKGTISGSQNVLGFRPERFSLGIKRHRDTLEMVIVRLVHSNTRKYDCGWLWDVNGGCGFIDHYPHDDIKLDTVKFWENNRIFEGFDVIHYKDAGFYDPLDENYHIKDSTYFDVVACSMKKWGEFNKNRNNKKKPSRSDFDFLKSFCEWKLEDLIEQSSYRFKMPYSVADSGVKNVKMFSDDLSIGCSAVEKDGYLDSVCVVDNTKYDPNKRLFNVRLVTPKSGCFYTVWKTISSYGGGNHWQNINYEYHFEIPESYWNAPFGMDNLVNRTIRFDHTNPTIFSENENDGYWNAVRGNGTNRNNAINDSIRNYFDGNEWRFNHKYGLLTPFEVQWLIFYPVSIFGSGSNVFRFDDESNDFMYSSSFELKFYGNDDTTHHFVAKVIGDLVDSTSNLECETDASKFVMQIGAVHPCQIEVSSTKHDSVRTPAFKHGNVYFFVGMNQTWTQADNGLRPSITYPAADTASWRDTLKDICSDTKTWDDYKKFVVEGNQEKVCYKYYGSGSRVHYYYNDYNDTLWKNWFLTDSMHYIRNLVNSPDYYYRPKFVDSALAINKVGLNGSDFSLFFVIDPLNYERFGESDSARFFVSLDTLNKIKKELAGAGITLSELNINTKELKDSGAVFSGDTMLYIKAQRWADTVAYRRSNDTLRKELDRKGEYVSLHDIYVYRVNPDANSCSKALYCVNPAEPQGQLIENPWIKDYVVESSSIWQIDFQEHPVLEISGNRDANDRKVIFKDSIVPRPPEIVEIRGNLSPGQTYSLSFLNNSTYYSISDGIKVDPNCPKYMDGTCHLAWFNVNRLQGHTQFLLTWGEDGTGASTNPTNAMHFNMYVGSNVKPEDNGVVKSMYGELSVSFPKGSLDSTYDFTVRTVNTKEEYGGFGVFKNVALTGPVMEVLPSMTFEDTTKLPRIKMQISKQEMENMHVTPQTLRLYKVDFDHKEFVPLENALYGFLRADGSAIMDSIGNIPLECNGKTDSDIRCSNKDSFAWDYVLISAETRTFSVFAVLDTLAASMRYMDLEVLPVIAKDSKREVRVDGVNAFGLYVDDDSLWNDDGDLTPMDSLVFTLDSNGVAHVTLPMRATEIDTNFVFAFAKVDSTEIFAPAVVKTLTVPATFVCHVPQDSLWMGLDNGYLAYGASCNHPGYGILSLYKDNSLIAEVQGEIPDTIKYDGKRLIGGSMMGSVPYGRYESRYVGVSALGEDMQLAGPAVRTDSARPVINAFEVLFGEDVLDRIFTVSANVKDSESGVARVVVSSKLGNNSRAPLELVPDSLGNVMGMLRLTRSELAKCGGCKLSLEMRAEDYGHNHTERAYESEKLYQYPTELALWYPSREGSGMHAYEYVGTGHHLNLDSVKSPWLGDAGIYFSALDDRASGIVPSAGHVSLGTSNSYSFETRIKIGYSGAAGWHRVLGFKGVGGLEMELLVHNRKLRLREGSRTWETPDNTLPVAKEWAHVVVTVDSSEVNFYVNGEIMKSASAEPLERELDGVFSAGADGENSFVGHVADMRMYKKALSGGEVFAMSLPVVDDKVTEPEIVEVVTVPMTTVNGGNGFEPEFSCAVAGNRYFESSRDSAKLTLDALIEKAATYKVMVYVRSASLQFANVSVMPSPGVRYSGTLPLSPVWRTVGVSDISMNLSAGMHTITLEAPEGLQIAGFALVTANVSPASIAWNSGLETPERKIKTFVRYEGFADKKVLQPRVRLRNVSNAQVRGYSVRYYFRGEESSMAKVHAYYPQDTVGLAVHSESAHTGFVEWKFANGVISSGGTVFNGDGPHFGVHYEDWTPWNPYDDPSFVENASANFVEDNGIIVLDADKRLIGGSCVEMEDSISIEVKARVYAAETRNDNQASEIQMKVENVGNVTLKNYDVRYYFFLEGGLAPEFNAYVLPDGVTASVENIGDGRWQVVLHASVPLVPGGSWKNLAQFTLHCENWIDIWNGTDDPSNIGLGRNMVEAVGVNVFDSLGNRIFGNEPVWPDIVGSVTCNGCTADSSGTPDIGLTPKNDAIPVHRTDDGLVISLPQYTNISLSLVNVVGVPVRNLYTGTLASGEQFIHVNWTGIDLNRTYLMLRVNGAIRSTKLLSLL